MIRPVRSRRGGDRVDFAVAAVAEYFSVAGESMRDGVAGDDDVVAVAGPAAADRDDGAGENLGVDAAPIVLGWRGDRLIVHRNDRLGDALITYRREAAMTITPENAPRTAIRRSAADADYVSKWVDETGTGAWERYSRGAQPGRSPHTFRSTPWAPGCAPSTTAWRYWKALLPTSVR